MESLGDPGAASLLSGGQQATGSAIGPHTSLSEVILADEANRFAGPGIGPPLLLEFLRY